MKNLQSMQLKNPILVGFGIKDKATFDAATEFTAGAIIGSAYIQALHDTKDVQADTRHFIKSIINEGI